MAIGEVAFLASRTNDLALAFFAATLLASVAAAGDPLKKCIGKVDLDACRNMTEIVSSKGYPIEEHYVVTDDGYVIIVFRIPYGRTGRGNERRPVVFLQHGLLCSSTDWVINLPHQSLGYILADAGYDVWLGNVRGNTYTSHKSLSKKSRDFWDFTFDEMIMSDLPAMIDHVLKATNSRSLFYVGHSQGTLILFGLLAERPEYNKKIKLFCALAPVATVTYMTSPLRHLAPFGDPLSGLLRFFGGYRFLQTTKLQKFVARTMCRRRSSRRLCHFPMFVIGGMIERSVNMTRLPVLISHVPAGTSTKNLAHFAQLYRSKRFQKYNYGLLKNRRVYGQRRPPEYDLTQVTAPVALFYSVNDVFCNLKDIRHLQETLPNVVLNHKVSDRLFSHLDFNFGVFARREVYEPMMRFMRGYNDRMQIYHTVPNLVNSTVENEFFDLVPVDSTVKNEHISRTADDSTEEDDYIGPVTVANPLEDGPVPQFHVSHSSLNE